MWRSKSEGFHYRNTPRGLFLWRGMPVWRGHRGDMGGMRSNNMMRWTRYDLGISHVARAGVGARGENVHVPHADFSQSKRVFPMRLCQRWPLPRALSCLLHDACVISPVPRLGSAFSKAFREFLQLRGCASSGCVLVGLNGFRRFLLLMSVGAKTTP
jgi:hypothetical protein